MSSKKLERNFKNRLMKRKRMDMRKGMVTMDMGIRKKSIR